MDESRLFCSQSKMSTSATIAVFSSIAVGILLLHHDASLDSTFFFQTVGRHYYCYRSGTHEGLYQEHLICSSCWQLSISAFALQLLMDIYTKAFRSCIVYLA